MIIKQSDFFWGLDKKLVKAFMDKAQKGLHEDDETLFREGDAADRFYVLLKGRVRLSIGDHRETVYVVSHAGEAFGWSSMLGRRFYSATAVCIGATKLLAFEKQVIETMLEKNPNQKAELYKRLAEMLANRLILSYRGQSTARSESTSVSFGTGQLQDYQVGA